MLSKLHMVRADIGETLVPIIAVIVWIVSSIARAGKKGKPTQRERHTPMPSRPASGEPQEQLRDFLEQLSGQSTTPAEPPPAYENPPDPSAPPVPASRPSVRDAPPVQRQTQRVPTAQPVTLPPLAPVDQTEHGDRSCSVDEARSRITRLRGAKSPSYEVVGTLRRRSSRAAKRLIGDLAHPDTARKAILLREILGPPLGLQDRRI
tara:strand:- start:2479 stop:3096 length:618 start_codon:yes stop_codon:yes gene_type:complete